MNGYELIRGKKVYNFENHSRAYINKRGEVAIRRQPPFPSCRNLAWQEAYYDRCEKLGDYGDPNNDPAYQSYDPNDKTWR